MNSLMLHPSLCLQYLTPAHYLVFFLFYNVLFTRVLPLFINIAYVQFWFLMLFRFSLIVTSRKLIFLLT